MSTPTQSSIFTPKARSTLLRLLQNYLFEPVDARHKKQLVQITLDHRNARKGNQAAFRYKGRRYHHPDHIPRSPVAPLDQSLHQRMDILLAEWDHFHLNERSQINTCLINALNLCKTPLDVLQLIPDSLHRAMPRTMATETRQNRVTLSDTDIETFNQHNATALVLLRERQTLNLLLE